MPIPRGIGLEIDALGQRALSRVVFIACMHNNANFGKWQEEMSTAASPVRRSSVMAGLVPAIHVATLQPCPHRIAETQGLSSHRRCRLTTWMAGTSPAMTLRPYSAHGQTSSCIIMHYSNLRADAVSVVSASSAPFASAARKNRRSHGKRRLRLLEMRLMFDPSRIRRRPANRCGSRSLGPARACHTGRRALNGEDRDAPIVDDSAMFQDLKPGSSQASFQPRKAASTSR